MPGAGHLFEEPGTLDSVQHHAIGWFRRHLAETSPETIRPARGSLT